VQCTVCIEQQANKGTPFRFRGVGGRGKWIIITISPKIQYSTGNIVRLNYVTMENRFRLRHSDDRSTSRHVKMRCTLRSESQFNGLVWINYISQYYDFPTMEHSFSRIEYIPRKKGRIYLQEKSGVEYWKKKVVIPVSLFIFLQRPPKVDSNDSVRSINEHIFGWSPAFRVVT
jgi:hypothetical protein